LDEHIGHVARRIGELSALVRELKDLRNQCQGIRTACDCGIIQSLGHGTGRASSRRQTTAGYVALTGSAEHSEQLMR